MTYDYVEKQVLKLLNQYTMAGNNVAETYNNQKDYLERIPGLVNDAMMEIATTVRKIQETIAMSDLECEEHAGDKWYKMPDDFYQFKSGDVLVYLNEHSYHAQRFMRFGRMYVVVPKEAEDVAGSSYRITYYRYPKMLPADRDSVNLTEELDNVPETHLAIPYYVAGMLAMHDDPFLSATLMNGYEDKLAKMPPDISADVAATQDAYDFYTYHTYY